MSNRTHNARRAQPQTTTRGRARVASWSEATTEQLLEITQALPFTAKGIHLVPVARANRLYVPMLCDLGDTSVTLAVETATTFITELGLYPGDTTQLFDTYARIVDWCTAHGVDRLSALVDHTAEQLICAVAELPDLSCEVRVAKTRPGFQRESLSEARAAAYQLRQRAHYVRNAVISLRSATVLTQQRDRKQRHATDTLALGLPELPSLEDRKGRPLTDEEILLCRFLVEIDIREEALPRPTLAYLLGENGVRPIESTPLETDRLDHRTNPTLVRPKGVWDFGVRAVHLNPYARATMPALLLQLRPGNQPLTYTGASPGTGASTASLALVIQRHLRRAGITDPEATAKSLSLWPVMYTLVDTQSMAEARKTHGGATFNVLEDLKLSPNEDEILHGTIHLLRRDNGQVVASVPAADFYDSSITKKGNRRKGRSVPEHDD